MFEVRSRHEESFTSNWIFLLRLRNLNRAFLPVEKAFLPVEEAFFFHEVSGGFIFVLIGSR